MMILKSVTATILLTTLSGAAMAQAPGDCQGDPNYDQLSFLDGSWDVHRGEDVTARTVWGRSLDGCGYLQTWTALVEGRQSGRGLLTYNEALASPTYFYVGDQGGNTVSISAETGVNEATFIIEVPTSEGLRTRRLRFAEQEDGSILETSVASVDGGAFEPEFELVWTRSDSDAESAE